MSLPSVSTNISIVVPCYNEEISLPKFQSQIALTMQQVQKEFPQVSYEIIFVNDGSKDKTLEILQDMRSNAKNITVLSFSRNFGKEAAILAGLREASGDGVILIDADLQDPPHLIIEMVRIWLNSHRTTKVIYARRTTRAGESKIRATLSEIFYKVSNLLSEVKIESGVRDFRLMDREVIDALLELKEYHRFSKAIFAWVGFKRECLEYEYIPHFKGSSSWSFWNLFKYAIEGIVSFSTAPLRIAFVVGGLISIVSVVYGIHRIIDTIVYGNPVAGYPSLMVVITFIGGIQLMLLGVIGEYIARIYEQVKMRPIYILEHLKDKDSDSKPKKTKTPDIAKSRKKD